MSKKTRVAVVFGGQSSEHEVSRFSAQSVISNIDKNKYDVSMIGITKDGKWMKYTGPVEKIGTGEWEAIAKKALTTVNYEYVEKGSCDTSTDVVEYTTARSVFEGNVSEEEGFDVIVPILHGQNGEDGTIQGLFEMANIPYVGCGVLGSALGMDKAYSKIIFEKAGIPQGKYVVFSRKQILNQMDSVISDTESVLEYPCFVKPSNAGSSVGVGKAHNRMELQELLINASKIDRRVLVEEFINGREIECAVLGNEDPIASTVGEIVPCNEFYDYEAKYNSGDDSKVVIPAELDAATALKIREYAIRAFKALDCSGLSRVDFFVERETGNIYINEINTLPGFTKISMYPKLWEASGIPYSELIDKLIELAIERFEDNKREI